MTLLLLPNYINPILPLVLILSYFYFNYFLNSSNEILIINQYINNKQKLIILYAINIILLIFYFFNNEIISPYLYKIYKEKEVEIRNNFILGVPSENELHVGEDLSIFFKSRDNNTYYGIDSVLYKDNQFINSEYAVVEYDKKGFNIIFFNGLRVKINDLEKSKTIFKKFIYHINNNNLVLLLFDKEHFNTLELLTKNEKDFYFQGHSRIYHYLLLIVIISLSNKIIFNNKRGNIFKLNSILFLLIIATYLINSFVLYKLIYQNYSLNYYYLVNVLFLILISSFVFKFYDSK